MTPAEPEVEAASIDLAAVDGKVGGPYRHFACRAGAERPGGDQAVSKRHVAVHHDGHACGVPAARGARLNQASVLNHQGARAKMERAFAGVGASGVDPGPVGDSNATLPPTSCRDIRNGNGDCRLDAGEINFPPEARRSRRRHATYLDVTAHQRKGLPDSTSSMLLLLWVDNRGTPLVKLSDRIERFTAGRFARRVPMHHFRHVVATSMALDDPHHVELVAALLGHGRAAVSERYYNLASSMEAGRAYQDGIFALHARLRAGLHAEREE